MGARACVEPGPLEALDQAPAGRILSEAWLRAYVVAHTHHSASERADDQVGSAAADAGRLPPDVDYILTCTATSDPFGLAALASGARANALADVIARGDRPSWLAQVEVGAAPLRLYKVMRQPPQPDARASAECGRLSNYSAGAAGPFVCGPRPRSAMTGMNSIDTKASAAMKIDAVKM
jgi:hypothetical protein